MKTSFMRKIFIVSLVAFGVVPLVLFAQGQFGPPVPGASESVTVINPLPSISSIPALIKTILEFVLKIGIPIVALAIIFSGFQFVTARGRPKELETAKRSILYTLLGAAILLGAWAIAILISETVLQIGEESGFLIINYHA